MVQNIIQHFVHKTKTKCLIALLESAIHLTIHVCAKIQCPGATVTIRCPYKCGWQGHILPVLKNLLLL